MTYDDLAAKLKKHGFKETRASIANKLARESLPAAFFLACRRRMMQWWADHITATAPESDKIVPLSRAS
jgi:Domain of unknown function (DUF6471)